MLPTMDLGLYSLSVVIMNMVYLVTETRVKVGKRGINDPSVKIIVTLFTYAGLLLLFDQKPLVAHYLLLTTYYLLLTAHYLLLSNLGAGSDLCSR